MMKSLRFALFFLIVVACSSSKDQNEVPIQWNTEKSIEMNRDFSEDEEIQIKSYFARQQKVNIVETGSGLRYVVIKEGEGAIGKPGQTAVVQYSVKLLDGTEIYATEKGEQDLFVIDKSEIESGIQEGIKKMKVGSRYKLVIPSHLAHGLVGNLNNIPPLSPIVVDIQLDNIK